MGKYENAKYLVLRKARIAHECKECGKEIFPKENYYSETLGLIDKGPNIVFYAYCLTCGPKSGLSIEDKK